MMERAFGRAGHSIVRKQTGGEAALPLTREMPPGEKEMQGSSAAERIKTEGTHSGQSSLASLKSAIGSELIYCLVSAGTVLFNKHVLSTFSFPAPNLLLFFQFLLAVVLLHLLHMLRLINLAPLRWDMIKLWMPVNMIFVLMNVTGFLALQGIGAGMFTVLKNLSNLMTICGDYFLYGNTYSLQVWACLFLMIVSAAVGGWTDMKFSASGYAWQLVNCCLTAAYSLHLSGVIKKSSRQHHGKQQLSEMSMVYYNNLLSVPPLGILSIVFLEPWRLGNYPHWTNTEFQVVAFLGGLMGFAVSFASIWCMARTSPTIYSLTGSLNKVVVAVVGMWYFKEVTNTANVISIWLGLIAGFLFVYAKQATPAAPSKHQATSSKDSSATPSPRHGSSGMMDEEAGLSNRKS